MDKHRDKHRFFVAKANKFPWITPGAQ